MKLTRAPAVAAVILSAIGFTAAQSSPFSIASDDDIKKTASLLAWDMLQYYKGNLSGQTPGILPGPPPPEDQFAGYYWWEAGAMWGGLIDYWRWTGDSTYNQEIMQAMLFQTGPNDDYQPSNVTASLGNDDQGFWGMTAMLAAENNFPNPPSDKPQWLALAQGVWETQASPARHDDTCGGGLRWQIPLTNKGYGYKNSIANGVFFNTGARLARYTGDKKYADWAEKTWNWMISVGFLDPNVGRIYDGANVDTNCTDYSKEEYSYVNGVFALGSAYMYNYTNGSTVWKQRTDMLVKYGLKTFFPSNIATEVSCENANSGPRGTCSQDMMTFKGFMHRWYATLTQIAPFTKDDILPVLQDSAKASLTVCTGGALGRQCSFKWASHKYDGITGAGQEMSVLGAVSALLIGSSKTPVSANSGGTSKGDPNAGDKSDETFQQHTKPATTADKAGAGIITFIILGAACGMFGWMSIGA